MKQKLNCGQTEIKETKKPFYFPVHGGIATTTTNVENIYAYGYIDYENKIFIIPSPA